jgi:hypothetical protein
MILATTNARNTTAVCRARTNSDLAFEHQGNEGNEDQAGKDEAATKIRPQ